MRLRGASIGSPSIARKSRANARTSRLSATFSASARLSDEHRAGDAVERRVEVDEARVGRRARDRPGEQPGGCLAEHGRVGLAPDEHRVLAVDRARERVVGADGGGFERVERDLGDALGDELRDALAHPIGELARGLAREREPEHLGHADVAVREQPDDPVRHRLGLAAARAGDDDARAVRVGLDDGALLGGGGVQPEACRDLERTDATRRAHADTAGTRCTRYCHAPNRDRKPSSPGPSNTLPAMVRPTSASRSRNAASASSSNGCCTRSV